MSFELAANAVVAAFNIHDAAQKMYHATVNERQWTMADHINFWAQGAFAAVSAAQIGNSVSVLSGGPSLPESVSLSEGAIDIGRTITHKAANNTSFDPVEDSLDVLSTAVYHVANNSGDVATKMAGKTVGKAVSNRHVLTSSVKNIMGHCVAEADSKENEEKHKLDQENKRAMEAFDIAARKMIDWRNQSEIPPLFAKDFPKCALSGRPIRKAYMFSLSNAPFLFDKLAIEQWIKERPNDIPVGWPNLIRLPLKLSYFRENESIQWVIDTTLEGLANKLQTLPQYSASSTTISQPQNITVSDNPMTTSQHQSTYDYEYECAKCRHVVEPWWDTFFLKYPESWTLWCLESSCQQKMTGEVCGGRFYLRREK